MAAALINDLHYSLLCKLALACNGHVNGLNTGIARNKRQLSNKLVKQLRSVETAYNLLRHVTVFSCRSLEKALDEALASESCAGTSNSTSVTVGAENGNAQEDPELLKAAADAHHKAIGRTGEANGVISKADWEAGNTARGRVFAPVPESTVMSVTSKAFWEAVVTGAQADPKPLKAAAGTYRKAIGSIGGENGVASNAGCEAASTAPGRVAASVPDSTVMNVHNPASIITDPDAPACSKPLENGTDAEAASTALMNLKDAVKTNQVASEGAPETDGDESDDFDVEAYWSRWEKRFQNLGERSGSESPC
mmetsp:Transcript_34842/g.68796  ORF Transcript_34842/g.68796 Transcript_34842/m.68796 type:complete len:309 (-) Transcript_34842:35-961(-)